MNNNLCWILILLSCCGCGNSANDCGNTAIPMNTNNCFTPYSTDSGSSCNDVLWLIILICLFSTCRTGKNNGGCGCI